MKQNKKETEEKCLKIAAVAAKHQTGKSRHILEMLNGEDYIRDEEERPDFVKIYQHKDKSKAPLMLGVEHFRVDQLSVKKKDGKVASTGVITENEIKNLYEEQYQKVKEGEFIVEDAVLSVGEIISEHVAKRSQTTYKTIIESFIYSIDKHTGSFSAYRENLNKYSNGKYDTKLALLIEIHTELFGLFFHNKKGVSRKKDGIIPLFDDMVKILEEKIDPRLVDYVILCFGETLFSDVSVVAFETNNMRKQIERRHLPVYQYIGDDILLDPFKSVAKITDIHPEVKCNDAGLSVVFNETRTKVSEEEMLNYMFYSLKQAIDNDRKGIPYVTNVNVEYAKEVLSDYIIGWHYPNGKGSWVVRPVLKRIDNEDFVSRSDKFENEWFEKYKEKNND